MTQKMRLAELENREGEKVNFLITYTVTSLDEVVDYGYWPNDLDMKESVEDFIYQEELGLGNKIWFRPGI